MIGHAILRSSTSQVTGYAPITTQGVTPRVPWLNVTHMVGTPTQTLLGRDSDSGRVKVSSTAAF